MSIVEYVSTKRAAEMLGMSSSYLNKLRCLSSTGPRFIKLGKAVRYSVPDLHTWASENTHRSTSEQARNRAPGTRGNNSSTSCEEGDR